MKIEWLDEPEDQDYPAAESYLSLLFLPEVATEIVEELRKAMVTKFKAKDIARACGQHLLDVDNSHVEKNREKVHDGKKLSPILLFRRPDANRVVICDGFHRVSAVYQLDEDAWIPCKIV